MQQKRDCTNVCWASLRQCSTMSRTSMTTCEISPITITLMREVGDWVLLRLREGVKSELFDVLISARTADGATGHDQPFCRGTVLIKSRSVRFSDRSFGLFTLFVTESGCVTTFCNLPSLVGRHSHTRCSRLLRWRHEFISPPN